MTTIPPAPHNTPHADASGARIRHLATSGAVIIGVFVCVFLTAIGLSAMGGYMAGQKQRNVSATQTTIASIDLQFSLGISDLDAGNFAYAAERFRWVLDHAPDYPGAADALVRAQQGMSVGLGGTAEPTLIPSTSENPDELFGEAEAFIAQKEWANAIDRLMRIQKIDSAYQSIKVRQMLHTAYSELGVAYLRGDRLQEGLYLLEQAEEIAPLEDTIGGERNLARLYLDGQTYWKLNWRIVIRDFEEIYRIAPNYRDVRIKLREAYIAWGDQLSLGGSPCDGVLQYDNALNMEPDDALRTRRDAAEEACLNPTALPTATSLFETPASPDATPEGDATANPIP